MRVIIEHTDSQLFDRSIEMLGINQMADQVVDACARMICTLHDYSRSQCNKETLAERMAEVHLQLGILSRFTGDEPVKRALRFKAAELQQLLDQIAELKRERGMAA